EQGATDLILSAGAPPSLRIDGHLRPATSRALTPEQTAALVSQLVPEGSRSAIDAHGAVDFSFQWADRGRVRGNAFRQRGTYAVALRAIPGVIPSFAELRLPQIVERLVELPKGLILMTGPTGAGKSTTQAAMIDWINRSRAKHVITIEDPIEYIHSNKRCIVDQREVGVDTPDFETALRMALREDPDVLLIGEMRDLESIRMGLTIAETGHLVFGTLHTNDTAQAINRLVDVFPGEQQQQIRVQLAATLQAVFYQQLLPRVGGGLIAAFETLVATYPVRNLIRDNKPAQLRNVVLTSAKDGMNTLEASLNYLMAHDLVTYEDAVAVSLYPEELHRTAPQAALPATAPPAAPPNRRPPAAQSPARQTKPPSWPGQTQWGPLPGSETG
ncbi:MAG TPA: type IV pilus twitching motility protein PilT, partial [Candidatus Dormibacteraeota bacterium]|nr:type IV pilus twitching motility protein PilT [Candidatus Dormibacteraeota bacterium]